MKKIRHHLSSAIVAFALTAAAPASAATVYESATYTGQDTGEYILTNNDLIGAAFTLASDTAVTGIGAQFGGFPAGSIFGAIVPIASMTAFPTGSSADLSSIAVGHTVFAVTGGTHDQVAPLSVNLAAGTYAVIFGSGQFGATGNAGLGDLNTPNGDPTLIRSFFSTSWQSFSPNSLRLFVQGDALAAPVPEPGEWAMLTVGLAGAGFVARRRKAATAA